jgi:formylglycine-generating enzyme required for sulfatase activity
MEFNFRLSAFPLPVSREQNPSREAIYFREVRGDSWGGKDLGTLLSSIRGAGAPDNRVNFRGFRVVLGGSLK